MKTILIMVFVIFINGCTAIGPSSTTHQTNHLPALQGDYFKFKSIYASREFHIDVRLPLGYRAKDAAQYPVIYVLDGDSLFPLLAPTHLFLHYDENLPEAIIVGISYGSFDPSINKRNADFSAPATDAVSGEDRAPQFLNFLKKELIPKIEHEYRANAAKRVLLGQSRAGYFVLWTALEDPDLFWGRIASNPAMTPGRSRFFEAAATHTRKDLRVAIASGTRDTEQRQRNAIEWGTTWTSRHDAPWAVKLFRLDGGTHAATIGETYRLGMLWLFQDEIDGLGVR